MYKKKAYEEIDRVVGKNRIPTFEDAPNLPYLTSVLNESLRVFTVVPLSVPHCTTENTVLGGYNIPKGVMILPDINTLHNSPKYWGTDAHEFRPERFNDFDPQDVKFCPFSIGGRQCPGMKVGKSSTFQVLASLLQRYEFCVPPGKEFKTPDSIFGLGLKAVPFPFYVKRR